MTLATLVRPEDLWIVPVAVLGVLLVGFNKWAGLGYVIIFATAIPVALGYGLTRGFIHIAVTIILTRIIDLIVAMFDKSTDAE